MSPDSPSAGLGGVPTQKKHKNIVKRFKQNLFKRSTSAKGAGEAGSTIPSLSLDSCAASPSLPATEKRQLTDQSLLYVISIHAFEIGPFNPILHAEPPSQHHFGSQQ
jgi:hypothetical protein